ncbi:MAG: DUF4143 domain-containing protein [Propionibacteriaceae bacterium]|nr:DUF4143 domain-containing protein [Propionibacteriaceae bacterium]
MQYKRRVMDYRVETMLEAVGGVVIEGPRACGKTATGLQHARSSVRMDASPQVVALAELDPASLLAGDTPRLIDEWQLAPNLWNLVRHEIDDRQAKGQFILSGSATPPDDIRRHSGAGRLSRLKLRTMTLSESGHSTDAVSLNDLRLTDALPGAKADMSYRDLAVEAVRGGWPALLGSDIESAMDYNNSYLNDLCSADIVSATGIHHDPVRLRRLLSSLARNIAGETTLRTVATDMSADGVSIDPTTVGRYLDALTTVFALEELPAWSIALRSKTRLRTRAKTHLADPSLACAALGASPERLARDPKFFGQVFEAMAIRDLRVYADLHRARVYHYRDETGLEVDAVIEYPNWSWAAIEVKLGYSMIEAAEKNLIKLRDQRVDTDRVGAPVFLAVVTGTEYAYTLPSGIHVVPLAALRA